MFRHKTPLYTHQEETLLRSYDKKNYVNFMEMGCGKSKVLIDNIASLYDNGHIHMAIRAIFQAWRKKASARTGQPMREKKKKPMDSSGSGKPRLMGGY